MDFFNSRYFRVNKTLLSLAGLWPYQTTKMRILTAFVSLFCVTLRALLQVIYIFTNLNDLDGTFDSIPYMISHILIVIKSICLLCNFKKFQELLQLTHENWNNLQKGQEMQIMMQYAEIGRKLTCAYFYYVMILFVLCYILMPFLAPLLDIISPLNETRPKELLNQVDYIFNAEKCYYMILLSELVSYGVCLVVVVAIDNIYFLLLKHICGMHAVLCHRLKNLKVHYNLKSIDKDQLYRNDAMEYRMQCCIQLDKTIRALVL